jgi:hypothetical protein
MVAAIEMTFFKSQLESQLEGKDKGKGHPITGHQGPRRGVEVKLYSFSTSALGGGGWSAPRPGCFTPRKDPVPIVQEAGWAPGPVWTCAKNLTPTGIRSPDRPAHSQSLYRLSYRAQLEGIFWTLKTSRPNLVPTHPPGFLTWGKAAEARHFIQA